METTIIQKLNFGINDNDFYIKRDDLFPVALGGNKARIALEFFSDMECKGCDCIIGYGSPKSNMCRAIALIAAKKNVPCYLVIPVEKESYVNNTNGLINELCQAKYVFCDKETVSTTIKALVDDLKSKGFNPYYVNGNELGIGNEAVSRRAYENVYYEIQNQIDTDGKPFDCIFLPSRTGMTQAGLISGKLMSQGNERIIGISISKKKYSLINEIKRFCDPNQFAKKNINLDSHIIVEDKYLCEGYGSYNRQIEKLIEYVLINESITLDPTYTGKAFHGMLEYIRDNEIRNKRILFIHTGGTPLFYDYFALKMHNNTYDVKKCVDNKQLLSFLNDIDNALPTPLSQRVNIPDYAEKIMGQGNAFVIEKNKEIIAAALFYSNDYESLRGYLSLLVTKAEYRRSGCAGALITAMEKEMINAGMKRVCLQTDPCNNKAVAFYSTHGYTISELNQKVIMEKELVL